MEIIRLCRTFPRIDSPGAGLHCFNFSKYIKLQTLVFTKYSESPILSIPENAQVYEINYRDLSFKRKSESLLRLILILISKIWGELVFAYEINKKLRGIQAKPKIIHLHSINYLFTSIYLKYKFNAKLIMNFGGTDLVRVKDNFLLKRVCQKADAVLYVAESMHDDLKDIFSNQLIACMGNGVDTDFFRPGNKNKKKFFLAVGNLRWQKGYEYLIDAFATVAEKYPEYKLLIAGEGPDRNILQRKINDLNLSKKTLLLGSQSRNDILRLFQDSFAYVLSSVSEGFPKSVIESIATETPVIVTDIGECKRLARGVGLVVDAGSSNSLAEAMISFIEDDSSYIKYITNCNVVRDNYSWQKMVSVVDMVYKEIIMNE